MSEPVIPIFEFINKNLKDWRPVANRIFAAEAKVDVAEGAKMRAVELSEQAATIADLKRHKQEMQAVADRLTKAINEMIEERYSDLDMMEWPCRSTDPEFEYFMLGVKAMWGQLKLIKAIGSAALSKQEPKS